MISESTLDKNTQHGTDQLKNKLKELENGYNSHTFPSGEAAIITLLNTLKAGDEIILSRELNSKLQYLLDTVYSKFDVKCQRIALSDIDMLKDSISDSTKLVWVESPSLPNRRVTDIKRAAEIAHNFNALLVVDNSYNTPFGQLPISLGADFSIYTDTSLLFGKNGFGCIVSATKQHAEMISPTERCIGLSEIKDSKIILDYIQDLTGTLLDKTSNALSIANFLNESPKIGRVFYPGLTTHIHHDLAKEQQINFGSHLSFYLTDDTIENAERFVRSTKGFLNLSTPKVNKTTIFHPAESNLSNIPAFLRRRSGIRDSLIVINAGTENKDNIFEELSIALELQ